MQQVYGYVSRDCSTSCHSHAHRSGKHRTSRHQPPVSIQFHARAARKLIKQQSISHVVVAPLFVIHAYEFFGLVHTPPSTSTPSLRHTRGMLMFTYSFGTTKSASLLSTAASDKCVYPSRLRLSSSSSPLACHSEA